MRAFRALIRELSRRLDRCSRSSIPPGLINARARRFPRYRLDRRAQKRYIPIKRKLSEHGMGGIKSDMRLAQV